MIVIEVINLKWNPAEHIIHDRSTLQNFEKWLAEEYIKIIKQVIKEQRYKSKWADLSIPYLKMKRRKGLSEKIWEATGYMQKVLKLKGLRRHHITIGFDKRVKHPRPDNGKKVSVLQIARWVEYGTIKMPPRPLYRNAYLYMRKHIHTYIDKYCKINGIQIP